MADSAQSLPAHAAAREKLFGTARRTASHSTDGQASPNSSTSETSTMSSEASLNEDPHSTRRVWERRWDASPEEWRDFLGTISKEYGLTDREVEKIQTRNRTYVETRSLSGNGGVGTSMIIGTVALFSKVFMTSLNELNMYRMHLLYDAIEKRDPSRGLLTFSNHQSVLDDPFLLAAVLPPRILLNPKLMRWGLCSLDICFQNAWISRTLRLGKALPIERLGGITQQFLQTAGEKLVRGDWVHIFPEGRVRQIGMGYSKRGVGKLLAMYYEAHRGLPLVVPMYHEGVEKVMPQAPDSHALESAIPRTGKRLFIMTGEPIDLTHIFHRLMPKCQEGGGTAVDPPACIRLYEEVADSMAITMRLLRAELREKVRSESAADLGEPFELS